MSEVSKVFTVSGPIAPSELGKTLVHEHIMFGFGGWYANDTLAPFDRKECLKKALTTIDTLKSYGVNTVIDATPNDCARDPKLLQEVSEKGGINIVCSSGLYSEDDGAAGYFKFRRMVGADITEEIFSLFMTEITKGIGTTGIKPGILKVASGDGSISCYEEAVFKAAARAQKETGIPIYTHTGGAATMGLEQIDLLLSEGADPKRIVIGHISGSADIAYHLALIEKGVYIGFDRLGLPVYSSEDSPVASIIGLIGIGQEEKIMMSHDNVWYFLGDSPIDPPATYIFDDVLPRLKKAGITDDKIQTMLTDNPKNLFCG